MEQNDDGQTDNESIGNYDSDTGSIFESKPKQKTNTLALDPGSIFEFKPKLDPIREEETDYTNHDVVMKVKSKSKSPRQNKFKNGVNVEESRDERNRKTTDKQQDERGTKFAKKRGIPGGSKTKKNRPKKYKKHSTRSKKVSKNKTRKRHSTRSKRQKKKKSQ